MKNLRQIADILSQFDIEFIEMPRKVTAFDNEVISASRVRRLMKEDMVVSKMEIPTQHGVITGKMQLSPTNYYNLDAIISVGYRVNSIQTTQFRIWATKILKEYMIKGLAKVEK